MTHKIIFALCLMLMIPAAEAAGPRVPTQKVMQDGCIKSGGTWRTLPPECDNMHPRSWAKLNSEQQKNCMASFNEPCECGSGKRFIYMGSVGCEKSNFPSDK